MGVLLGFAVEVNHGFDRSKAAGIGAKEAAAF